MSALIPLAGALGTIKPLCSCFSPKLPKIALNDLNAALKIRKAPIQESTYSNSRIAILLNI